MKIDWTNKQSVIEYCKKLGKGCCVIKVEGRNNFNITHLEHAVSKGYTIVYQ